MLTPELSSGAPDSEIFKPNGEVVDAISAMLEAVITDSSSLSSPIDESIWFLETGINYALSNAVDSLDVLVIDEVLEFQLPLINDSVNHGSLRDAFVVLYERVDSLVNHHEANFRFADVIYVDHGANLDLNVRIVLTEGYLNSSLSATNFMISPCKFCGQVTSSTSCPWKLVAPNAIRVSRRNYGTFSIGTGLYTNVRAFNDNTHPLVQYRLIETDFLPGRCNALFAAHKNSSSTTGCLVWHQVCISSNQIQSYTDAMIDQIRNVCGKDFHPISLYMPNPQNAITSVQTIFWETHLFQNGELVEKSQVVSFELGSI